MRERIRGRWSGLPAWARWTLAVYSIGFLEGTGAHCLDLVRGGIHAYASFAPLPLQVFFVCLVLLDPLVVVLVGLVRTEGVRLAGGVMALDVLGNWIVNWPRLQEDPAWLLRPVGLLPITLFGLFVLASSPSVHRVVARLHPGRTVGDSAKTALNSWGRAADRTAGGLRRADSGEHPGELPRPAPPSGELPREDRLP